MLKSVIEFFALMLFFWITFRSDVIYNDCVIHFDQDLKLIICFYRNAPVSEK